MGVDLFSVPVVPPDGSQHGLRLCGAFCVARFVKGGACLLKDVCAVVGPGREEGARVAPEHTCPLLIRLRVQLERLRVVRSRPLECVHRERAITRLNEGDTRLSSKSRGGLTSDTCKFEGAEAVMGQHL